MFSLLLDIKQAHSNEHETVVSKERNTYNNGLELLSRKTQEKHRKAKNEDDYIVGNIKTLHLGKLWFQTNDTNINLDFYSKYHERPGDLMIDRLDANTSSHAVSPTCS